ncbi:odorant receptor 82a-like [Fopius arisanus]|uniref:Odorant receptor n=1 Tax=Fopius arisanus TaxID=64838 RepID=A0A9R1SXF4_9HYME|nr:PREDICTED: odorant receptor 82a-like [Fopius arisanus]
MTKEKNLKYNEIVSYAIRPYKLIAQSLGIWCMTCHNAITKIQLTIICILLVTNALSLFHELNPKCGVLKDKLIPVSTGICCCLSIMKILSIRLNRENMIQIITSIIDNWSSNTCVDDLRIMDNASKVGRKIYYFQLVSTLTSVTPMYLCGMGNAMVFDPRRNVTEIVKAIPLANPCFYGNLFVDYYSGIYLLQILQVTVTIIGNVGCDCYFFGITMLLVGQIRCFASDIEKLEPQECEQQNRQILRLVIRRHTHLIRMADHLERTFSAVVALQVMANIYQVSMGGLQILLSIRIKDGATAINFTIFISIFLVQLSIYSYAGECLSSSISYLQTCLYCCPWYQMTPKTNKDFVFIIARCGKPFHLTAGKIIPMNLESYTDILKTLISYFSVMRAMFDK